MSDIIGYFILIIIAVIVLIQNPFKSSTRRVNTGFKIVSILVIGFALYNLYTHPLYTSSYEYNTRDAEKSYTVSAEEKPQTMLLEHLGFQGSPSKATTLDDEILQSSHSNLRTSSEF